MGRNLVFSIGGQEYTASTTKVDRSKLYGKIEKLALDDDGAECQLVSMDGSGTIIIPKGGVSLAVLTSNGLWVDRSELNTVRLNGTPAELVPSSYGVTNLLTRTATEEELLDCTIKAFYHLSAAVELIAAIGNSIFMFDYCYNASYETTPAFLLVSEQELFMLTGQPNDFTYIGFEEISVAVDDEPDDEDDGDDIDFKMF